MDFATQQLQRTLTGRKVPAPVMSGPQEAVVTKVNADGTLEFVVPAFNAQVAFGPAPYPTFAGPPPVGTRCLAVFVGTTGTSPWITTFRAWPAP